MLPAREKHESVARRTNNREERFLRLFEEIVCILPGNVL